MLEIKIKEKNEIDATGKKVYLMDGTGEYDALLNPTGYGGTIIIGTPAPVLSISAQIVIPDGLITISDEAVEADNPGLQILKITFSDGNSIYRGIVGAPEEVETNVIGFPLEVFTAADGWVDNRNFEAAPYNLPVILPAIVPTINPLRENIAIFPIGFKVDSKGGKTPIEFQPFDPFTSVEWTAKVPRDGWLQFSLVFPPIFDTLVLEEHEIGDIFFSSEDYGIYKKVSDATFKLATAADLAGTEFESKIFEQFHIANSSRLKILLNQRKVELMMDSENLSNVRKIKETQGEYDRVRSIIQAAVYQFCIGNKYQAADHIEFLETNNYEQL